MNRIATLACGAALVFMGGAAVAQDAPAPPPGPPPFMGGELAAGPWDIATEHGPIHVEVVSRELERPWGLAFLPDGGMLVTERTGRLRHIDADGTLDPTPIAGLPEIYTLGIAGLMDIALHPDFAENGLVYLTYSKNNPENADEQALAVLRGRWDGAHMLNDVEDIFVALPYYGPQTAPERCCGQGPSFGSFGGRMLFDDDGYLYVTSGDRNYGEMVQDPSNHFGKLMRLNDDGSAPADNPWVGREGHVAEAWTTGHRNPLGLTINPQTGDLWESEFGPRGGDEINRIIRGSNYGWIQVTQGFHYDGTPAEGVSKVPGMTDPVLAFGPPSINPGGLAFYAGGKLPGWEGDLLFASFTQGLLRYDTDEAGMPINQPEYLLKDLGQRWRDVEVGPDGVVYLLTDQNEGALLKITPGE